MDLQFPCFLLDLPQLWYLRNPTNCIIIKRSIIVSSFNAPPLLPCTLFFFCTFWHCNNVLTLMIWSWHPYRYTTCLTNQMSVWNRTQANRTIKGINHRRQKSAVQWAPSYNQTKPLPEQALAVIPADKPLQCCLITWISELLLLNLLATCWCTELAHSFVHCTTLPGEVTSKIVQTS